MQTGFIESGPPVSVIVTCYNKAKWINQAIQSCIDQTYRNCEIIVVDDGSTDGSLDEIRKFGDQVRLVQTNRFGAGGARNEGFNVSNGQFIQYLDGDDYLQGDKISRQMSAIDNEELVYSDTTVRLETAFEGVCLLVKGLGSPEGILNVLLENQTCTGIHAYLYNRNLVERVGPWSPKVSYQDDNLFNIKAASLANKAKYVPGEGAVWRRVSGVFTLSNSFLLSKEGLDKALTSLEEKYKEVRAHLENIGQMNEYRHEVIDAKFEKLREMRKGATQLDFDARDEMFFKFMAVFKNF
jgi:glycosyltransferase involved in cell wall biosynthesis